MKRKMLIALLLCLPVSAWPQQGQRMVNITAHNLRPFIYELSKIYSENYLDPVMGAAVADSLLAKYDRKGYSESAANPAELAAELNADLKKYSGSDWLGLEMIGPYNSQGFHFWVHIGFLMPPYTSGYFLNVREQKRVKELFMQTHSEEPIPIDSRRFKKSKAAVEDTLFRRTFFHTPGALARHDKVVFEKRYQAQLAYLNFGQEEVRMLDNGTAYWKINYWAASNQRFGDKMIAAQTLVQDAGSLIIDLRGTSMGSPQGLVSFLAAFVGDGKKMSIGKLQGREKTQQLSVSKKMIKQSPAFPKETPIYVLIDKKTGGLSEWAAFWLQQNRRAILVGESTSGQGTLPFYRTFWREYALWMPTHRILLPDGACPWDKKGVMPDREVISEAALDSTTAQVRRASDKTAMKFLGIENHARIYDNWRQAEKMPLMDSAAVAPLLGNFDLGTTLAWESGRLRLQRRFDKAVYFRHLKDGIYMAEGLFNNGKAGLPRGGDQNNQDNGFTRAAVTPLYMSFLGDAESSDLMLVYTNGRHYQYRRIAK